MNVQFKGNETVFECTEPVEQKLFKTGVAAAWVIMFNIFTDGDMDSAKADEIITENSISEMIFSNSSDKQSKISGYSAITSCTIRHKEEKTAVELQFTKKIEPKNEEGTGEVNGEV